MVEFDPFKTMKDEPLTSEKFNEIIASKDMEQFVGYVENGFFDVKEFFYNLSNPDERHRLCKDITAFANNNGGYLLIGFEPDKPKNAPIEYIKAAKGISEFPNFDCMNSILSDYVYPNSIGMLVENEKIIDTQGRNFLLIKIKGGSEDKPFFVKKDAKNYEFAAYYVRTQDRGTRQDIEYLHELTHQGIYFEKYLKNIAGANEKILNNTDKLLKKTNQPIATKSYFNIEDKL